MDTVGVEQAMKQCWEQVWPEVQADAAHGVGVRSGLVLMRRLMELMRQVCTARFRAWLEQADCWDDTLERDGRRLRFKLASAKEFVTPCGPLVVTRRLFQEDHGGPTVAPLDEAWGMVGQFATPEVREVAAFLLGLVTPEEAEQVLEKSLPCPVGRTTLKKLAGQFGEWVEEHESVIVDVRAAEAIPAPTRVLCASLDGTNLRLAEPGPKPGRPVAGDAGELAPTCFKNAMIGTVSLYGGVPPDEVTPTRLQTRCVARMPEESSPTFRRQFEAEVSDTLARCDPDVKRVLVLDAAKSLWSYVESQPLFADFDKIVDFHHAVEHLALASDALFGKGTDAAKTWTARHRHTLLEHDDGARRVIRAMDRAVAQHRLSKAARREVAQQRQFFVNNGDRMMYATFRTRGLPIGSGPVEAAGKTLVKIRLCRSGMRWTRTGGQHILGLRTLIKSDRWNSTWSRYLNTLQSA
jgi:hypothetical protein